MAHPRAAELLDLHRERHGNWVAAGKGYELTFDVQGDLAGEITGPAHDLSEDVPWKAWCVAMLVDAVDVPGDELAADGVAGDVVGATVDLDVPATSETYPLGYFAARSRTSDAVNRRSAAARYGETNFSNTSMLSLALAASGEAGAISMTFFHMRIASL